MTLDLDQIVDQLATLADEMPRREEQVRARNDRAYAQFLQDQVQLIAERASSAGSQLRFPGPEVNGHLITQVDALPAPADYIALAADGSLISVDRHAAFRCYVINVGSVMLRYGETPDCVIDSRASLRADERDLTMVDPEDGVSIRRVDELMLGIEQGIEELERLADLIGECPPDLPLLALVDGPLVVWGLSDPRIKGLIQAKRGIDGRSMLERYITALDLVKERCQDRLAALVGYVSYPGSDHVANLVRLAYCPKEKPGYCKEMCRSTDGNPAAGRACDDVATNDRTLFERHLRPGQRSTLFKARRATDLGESKAPDISYCYLHAGDEIARLELPQWVLDDPTRLELAVSLSFDQAQRGQGYPVALAEAHERAVITGRDRDLFWRFVEMQQAITAQQRPGSAKSRSKRVRGV